MKYLIYDLFNLNVVKMRREMNLFVFFGILSLMITSCAKQDLVIEDLSVQNDKAFDCIEFNDFKILSFKDEKVFNEKLKTLENKNDLELDKWEMNIDFISMRRAFEEIVEDELNYYDSKELKHSSLLDKYPNAYVVAETIDSCQYLEMNIYSDVLSKVVNPDGLLKIGDKIYQHSHNKIKVINNSDPKDIRRLIEVNNTIVDENIYVVNLEINRSSFHRTCQSVDGSLKVVLYETFMQNQSEFYPNRKATTYWITVRSLQKRLWGAWYDNKKADIYVTGSFSGNSTYGWKNGSVYDYIVWSGNYTHTKHDHTLQFMLPYQLEGYSGFETESIHPEIYQSWHRAVVSTSKNQATCTISYP